jgi:cyclohexanecarboxyl-CoA dehydrogenase
VAECVGERCSEVAHRLASPATRPFRAREAALCIERDLVREMGELGFLGPELPESFGGLGVDCLTSGLLLEQMALVQIVGSDRL